MSRLSHHLHTPERSLPATLTIVAFSCGVILLYQQTLLPPSRWLFPAGIALLCLLFRIKSALLRPAVWFLGFLVLGSAWGSWHSELRLAERLPGYLEGERVALSGYVCDLPQTGSFDSLRFSFCVVSWEDQPRDISARELPGRIRLSWYGRAGRPLPDHRLRLEVVLKRPHGTLNTEGFRYEDWLFRKGYRATGSVRDATADNSVACGWHCRYHAWHQGMAINAHDAFAEAEQYPLIASLLIGNRGHLTSAHWQTLRATGTIHLVAISGLHLGLVAIGAGFVARKLLLVLPVGGASEASRRRIGFGVVMVCCLAYALIAGFTVPTRRALIMVLVAGWHVLLAREASVWKPFCLALFLVLLLDPFAPLDQGFWLSFGAVGVLLTVFAGRLVNPGWFKGLVLAQLAVFAGLWPFLAALGHTQPLAGLLANLVAIPWVSLVVMPALFIGTLLVLVSGGALTDWVISVLDAVLWSLMLWLKWVEQQAEPVAASMPVASPWLLAILAVLVLAMIRVPDSVFRLVAAVAVGFWLVMASSAHQSLANTAVADPEIRILDVGQGLSVLVRVDDKALLYDTGPEVRGVFSAVESTLIPNLRALGINRVDQLVISHADSDHAGGLAQLVTALEVSNIRSGEPGVVADMLADIASPVVKGCSPDPIRWRDVEFEFWRSSYPHSGNDGSCVMRLYHASSGTDILFTGDISRRVEAELLKPGTAAWLPRELPNRLVLAPHHGSKTSSSARWVDAVRPDWVVYTAGYRHRYGHPHAEVVSRYESVGARHLNTACSGEIVISLAQDGLQIIELRHNAPFWIQGKGLTRDQCKIP